METTSRVAGLVLLIALGSQATCHIGKPKESVADSNISDRRATRTPTPVPRVVKNLNAEDSNLIYGKILSNIWYGGHEQAGSDGVEFERFTGDYWYVYRQKTISPKYIDRIVGRAGISDELVQQLKSSSEQPEILWNELGDKLTAKAVAGDEDLSVLLIKAKKKYPKAKAVLDFSKIALSVDGTQALVFVEYFSEERKLVGVYFLVPLVRETDSRFSVGRGNIKAVPVFDGRRTEQ